VTSALCAATVQQPNYVTMLSIASAADPSSWAVGTPQERVGQYFIVQQPRTLLSVRPTGNRYERPYSRCQGAS
jgi:hypothetical protein